MGGCGEPGVGISTWTAKQMGTMALISVKDVLISDEF